MVLRLTQVTITLGICVCTADVKANLDPRTGLSLWSHALKAENLLLKLLFLSLVSSILRKSSAVLHQVLET